MDCHPDRHKRKKSRVDGECASQLAARAAEQALNNAGISAEELDLIICATISGDMPLPATASIVQEKIGAKKAAAFDLSAGCSGFVYALTTANSFVCSGTYNKVLVSKDLHSKVEDYMH